MTMTRIRERIADWISGGAVTMWRDNWAFEADDKLYWMELAAKRREALVAIACCPTTDPEDRAADMERIAREALK
jgi:hypothetical protein